MLTVTVRNMRLNLSKYLHIVEKGNEEIIVQNRHKAVAKIVPFNTAETKISMAEWLENLEFSRNSIRILDKTKNSKKPSERIVREDRDARG